VQFDCESRGLNTLGIRWGIVSSEKDRKRDYLKGDCEVVRIRG